MKFPATLLFAASMSGAANAYSFVQPMRLAPSIRNSGTNSLRMISTGDDRSERQSLDISKTTYTSLIKAPKDAYIAVSYCIFYLWVMLINL
jgi:hypothetical protein